MTILVGMETEWFSEDKSSAENILSLRAKVDYLVGSVHHLFGIPIDFSPEMFMKVLEKCDQNIHVVYNEYFDSQFEMLVEIKPEVVGHFDLIRLYTSTSQKFTSNFTKSTWDKIIRNIKFIASYGGLIELNSRAFRKGLKAAYPLQDILSEMIKIGTKFTLSDDSHGPDDVGLHYKSLQSYLIENKIQTVYFPSLNGSQLKYDNICDHPFWNKYN